MIEFTNNLFVAGQVTLMCTSDSRAAHNVKSKFIVSRGNPLSCIVMDYSVLQSVYRNSELVTFLL